MDQQGTRGCSVTTRAMAFLFFVTALISCPDGVAQTTSLQSPEDQPAEKVFKNIQALKGMRAADLQGAMSFIASSLNVDCDYCHRQDFSKDITKQKLRAREMIRMVRQINQEAFRGENTINCFTCHQGHTVSTGAHSSSSTPSPQS